MRAQTIASLFFLVIAAGAVPAVANERFVDDSFFVDGGTVIVHKPFVSRDVAISRIARPRREVVVVPSGGRVVVLRGGNVILSERATGFTRIPSRDGVIITRGPGVPPHVARTFPRGTVIINRGSSTFGGHGSMGGGGRR
jgi:hypothetical protein